MQKADLEQMGQKLASLQKQVAELKGLSTEFPAFERNTIRIEASLNMMAIALGRSVLENS
jgi:hypothetical protein